MTGPRSRHWLAAILVISLFIACFGPLCDSESAFAFGSIVAALACLAIIGNWSASCSVRRVSIRPALVVFDVLAAIGFGTIGISLAGMIFEIARRGQ